MTENYNHPTPAEKWKFLKENLIDISKEFSKEKAQQNNMIFRDMQAKLINLLSQFTNLLKNPFT